MKKILIAGSVILMSFGLIVILGVLFIGGIFKLTRPVVDASEQFLALLAHDQFQEAYASAADGLRAQIDEASFTAAAKQLGLPSYSTVSWRNREIKNHDGIAEGIVTVKNGNTKAISVRLVKENEAWKVVDLRFGGVDLAQAKVSLLPPQAELERITTRTLLDFNQAVQAKDFTSFYNQLAEQWKTQTTPADLRNTFQAFLDQNVDIGPIESVKPRMTPATTITDEGTLVVSGDYPTQPSQVKFELKFISEHSSWKLVGISVSIGQDDSTVKVDDQPVDGMAWEQNARRLIRQDLAA